jgi:cell division protein FtsB
MAAALEDRSSREVISRNEAIKALKRENKTLEAEKARLSDEVKDFSST